MQGIEFEEDNDFKGLKVRTVPSSVEKPSFIMNLLEKFGIANKTTANFILLGITAILFGITIFLYAGLLTKPAKDWSLDARVAREAQREQR